MTDTLPKKATMSVFGTCGEMMEEYEKTIAERDATIEEMRGLLNESLGFIHYLCNPEEAHTLISIANVTPLAMRDKIRDYLKDMEGGE